jgi:zinc transporter 1
MSDTVSQADAEQTETDHAENNGKKIKPKKQASMNMHGVFLHVLADALGSVAVIISALIIKFVPHDPNDTKHWTVYIDPTLSIVIVIIITISTVRLFRDTTSILLQTIPKSLDIQKIKSELLDTVPEIMNIHEFHVWRLTNEKVIASAHLYRQNLSNYMSIADKVKKFFHSKGIHSITVQYECDSAHQTPLPSSSTDDQTKLANDCLLRCGNPACDNQACCTIKSARSDTLGHDHDDNTMQISAITQPHQYDNPLHVEIPIDESGVHEHKSF